MSRIHPTNKPPLPPKPPNQLFELYKKNYPGRKNVDILKSLINSFSTFNYNKNKAQNYLNFPNMSKEEYKEMIKNLSVLLKTKKQR